MPKTTSAITNRPKQATQRDKQEKRMHGTKTQEKMLTTEKIINMRRTYKLWLAS